jgi:tetratricopeptide (TPR) repeat protein
MIATAQESEVKQTSPTSSYKVSVPSTNPLMPGAAVSLVKEGKGIALSWENTSQSETEGIVEKLAEEALSRTHEGVERFPSSSRAYTNLGVAQFNAGAIPEATSAFERALELDPDNYIAGSNLAKLFIEIGKYEEAEGIYKRLSRAFTDNVTPLMSLGYLAMRRGQFEEAERLFREIINRKPATPVPFYHLAILLLRNNAPKEAIGHLRTAIRHNVRSADLYQALGVAFALAGQNERSLRAFKTALTLSPNLGSAVKGIANTLLKVGDIDSVIDVLTRHLDREPNDWEAHRILAGAYMGKQRQNAARAQFMQVLELQPLDGRAERSSEISNDIGVSYFREGNLKESEEWFKRSIKESSAHGTLPYRNLTNLYSVQEKYREALDVLKECEKIFGEDEYIIIARSFFRASLGDFDRAISDLERLISNGTENKNAYGLLSGFLADEKHDYQRALAIMEEAYLKFPTDELIINNLAYAHLMLGHIEAARMLLENDSIVPKAEQQVALTATRGLLYLREGNFARARELYKKAALIASQQGNKALAIIARQKMHLEFARDAIKRGNRVTALLEVDLGLDVGKGNPSARNDLVLLKQALTAHSA